MGIFGKINFGLSKTRNKMSGAIDDMLDSFDSFEDDMFVELEEILVMGDVGVTTAVQVVEELKSRVKSGQLKKTAEVKKELQKIIADLLYGGEDMGLVTIPSVILVIGVNGAGKTTTIGKMAAMYKSQGKKVILGAADTFRAAAIDQLDVWAQRADVDIIKHKEGADPAAVIYDTIQAGIARNCDIIICDTAGRLHNKKNLMEELGKIYRVMDKELPYADREVLLVLDATTGQNAVNQAREFMQVAELTGIVLTKLDGTARGGVVLSIKNDLKIPVKFIGVGEALDDLQPFNPAAFAKSLFEAASKHEEEDENENSLSELINSDDYRNYVPEEDTDEDSVDIKEVLQQVLADIAVPGDEEYEEEYAAGQENAASSEKTEENSEKSSKKSAETAETSDEKEEITPDEKTRRAEYEQKQAQIESIKAAEEAEQKAAEAAAAQKAAEEAAAAQKAAEEAAAQKAAEEAAQKAAEAAAQKAAEEAAAQKAAEAAAQKAAEEAAKKAAEEAAAQKAADEEAAQKAAEETGKKKERRGFFGLFNRHS